MTPPARPRRPPPASPAPPAPGTSLGRAAYLSALAAGVTGACFALAVSYAEWRGGAQLSDGSSAIPAVYFVLGLLGGAPVAFAVALVTRRKHAAALVAAVAGPLAWFGMFFGVAAIGDYGQGASLIGLVAGVTVAVFVAVWWLGRQPVRATVSDAIGGWRGPLAVAAFALALAEYRGWSLRVEQPALTAAAAEARGTLMYRLQLDTDEIRCPSGRAQTFRIAEAWIERQRVVRAFVLARDRGFEYVVVRFADGPDGEPPRFYYRVVLASADGTASVALNQDFPARRGGSTASDVLGAPLPEAVQASCVDYAAR